MVLDTGADKKNTYIMKHIPKDYEFHQDENGHGTSISWFILKDACEEVELYPCKFYGVKYYINNIERLVDCLEHANMLDIDIINLSGGGRSPYKSEKEWISKFLKKRGRLFIAAAGNNNQDLDKNPYYPASYRIDGLRVVGALDPKTKKRASYSSYADWIVWEIGTANSFGLNYKSTIISGTSVSTAIYTGKIVKRWCEKRRKNAIHQKK